MADSPPPNAPAPTPKPTMTLDQAIGLLDQVLVFLAKMRRNFVWVAGQTASLEGRCAHHVDDCLKMEKRIGETMGKEKLTKQQVSQPMI